MGDASALNATLMREAPALVRCLSDRGRAAAFPRGIPFQAAAAKHTRINGTIGQLTDGHGEPMPLPEMARCVNGLDPQRTFLYSPIAGPAPIREAWRSRQRALAQATTPSSLPFVTHGLTHGIAIAAQLFADPDLDIVLPSPCWGNYDLIFRLAGGGRVCSYPFFADGGFNVDGLSDALDQVRGKALVILNFPSNPTGYCPTPAEADRIVAAVTEHAGPAVVISDDAYQGWVYDDSCVKTSLFWRFLAAADPERLFPMKVDGATKELVFFASRVGFLTHGLTGDGETALLSKLKCLVRGTVGSASGPSMALMEAALADPGLQDSFELRRRELAGRHTTLKSALATLSPEDCVPYPFNSAFFALLRLTDRHDAEELRQRLIDEYSVGTIAFASQNAIRVAYCSLHEEAISEAVGAIAQSLRPRG